MRLSPAELHFFDATGSARGYQVVAVKTNGEHLPLGLSLQNVLLNTAGHGKAVDESWRSHNQREATFVSSRLNAMLERTRRGHRFYRA
ncbi:MAG: hypothetical protein KF850_02935 [Labilithrix sp.]|nr:hypothetical protein [Labilithrix sp.]